MKPITFFAAVAFYVGCVAGIQGQEKFPIGSGKIVGGQPSTISENPWLAALIIDRPDGSFFCGGSFISSRWILSAAHCFGNSDTSIRVHVKANSTDYMKEGSWVEAARFVVHPNYDPNTHEHDIALLEVPTTIRAKVIPMAAASTPLAPGEPLLVAGWGVLNEAGQRTTTLMKATVPYVDNATCNLPQSYDGKIRDTMMCAGEKGGGVDSCQGDSGGPLVKGTKAEEAILVGIVSFGDGCAEKLKYGVYTRVSTERNWIIEQLNPSSSK